MEDSVLLYTDNPELKEFDAVVTRTGPKFVVLDRTGL